MASSKNTTSEIGLQELVEIWDEFEKTNDCELRIAIVLERTTSRVGLSAEITAFERRPADVAPVRLASTVVRSLSERLVSMAALCMLLLYRIDAEIMQEEYRRVHRKRA